MFVGIFATGVRVGSNLLLLPILLNTLPSADLALWWVLVSLGGFAYLADFGFGSTITRVYSYLWAGAEDFQAEGLRPSTANRAPNLRRIRELDATVRLFYWWLSIAATIVIAIAGTCILLKPVAAVSDPQIAWMAWGGQVLLIGYGLGTNRWMLACQGLGRMREIQAASLWSGLAYVGITAALLLSGWGLMAMVIASFARSLITRNYCRRVYLALVTPQRDERQKADMSILKRLWPNASKMGVLAVGAYLISSGNVYVCSQVLGPEFTASFGLSAQIGAFLTNFASLWLVVKWPTIAMLRSQGRLEEMSTLFARRLALTMGTFVLLAGVVALSGNWLLNLKGTHTRLLPAPFLIVYFVHLAQQLFYVQFGSLAYSENVVPFFRVSIFTGIAEVTLSYLMARAFGLWGMLLAPLIAELACSSWYTVRRGFRGQPLTASQLLRAAFANPMSTSFK
jgi:O-antigen/teichoic acid export membrane protein